MRTETIEIYNYQDIIKDDDLKDRVIDTYRSSTYDYHYLEEYKSSLEAFKESISIDDDNCSLTGLRLRTWLINNVVNKYLLGIKSYKDGKNRRSNIKLVFAPDLTGLFSDSIPFEPIEDFIKDYNNVDTLEDLIDMADDSIDRAIQREIEYQNSEEYILDMIKNNEYEFYSDGKMA